jgi:hypothetical protein
MNLVKAYKNPDFLLSEEARSVRILCEYLEPKRRFENEGVRRAVIFFGSARLRPHAPGEVVDGPDYYRAAADLAERMATWTLATHPEGERYHVCTGGGPGIMQAAHEGAARVDVRLNVGLNISLPFEQNVNPHLQENRALEFHYFFMRKFWFMNLARALVVFPGGFGTLDELFELLTLTQTGKSSPMPIVLYGGEFWRQLINFDLLVRRGLISREDLDLFVLADDVEGAFRHLTGTLP